MKYILDDYMNSTIKKLNSYEKNHSDCISFYNDIYQLELDSVQKIFNQVSLDFLNEIKHLINIIFTIINKPNMSSKYEENIIRSSQAKNISNEMLINTMKDSRLWKDNYPEYIYNYQNIDQLATYENIFICTLINHIYKVLNSMSMLYSSVIKTYNYDNLCLDNDDKISILNKINDVFKAINHIKKSAFYKLITKENKMLTNVIPNNVLLHNRLYNYCYKFYLNNNLKNNMVSTKILCNYYYVLLLKNLYAASYKFDGNKYSLYFDIEINKNIDSIDVVISKGDMKVKHKIVFNNTNIENKDDYLSIERLSIWNLCYLDFNNQLDYYSLTELELVDKWFKDKTIIRECSYDLYIKYCPICKGKNINKDDKYIKCKSCNSAYSFIKEEKMWNMWIMKVRGNRKWKK